MTRYGCRSRHLAVSANHMVEATTTREASVVGTFGTGHIGSGTQISAGQTIRCKHIVRD